MFSKFFVQVFKAVYMRQVELPFWLYVIRHLRVILFPYQQWSQRKPQSELTSAEHIVAISLAWCVISVLSHCWGCCSVGTHAWGRALLSLVTMLLSQSLEFRWLPPVSCHSSWLQTTGNQSQCHASLHGRLYGTWFQYWKQLMQKKQTKKTQFIWYLFLLYYCWVCICVCIYLFSCVRLPGHLMSNRLKKATLEFNGQTSQFLVNQRCWY